MFRPLVARARLVVEETLIDFQELSVEDRLRYLQSFLPNWRGNVVNIFNLILVGMKQPGTDLAQIAAVLNATDLKECLLEFVATYKALLEVIRTEPPESEEHLLAMSQLEIAFGGINIYPAVLKQLADTLELLGPKKISTES